MKSKLILWPMISGYLFLSACGSRVADENWEKADQLAEYKVQMEDLRKKIAQLERELNIVDDKSTVNVEITPVVKTNFEHFVDVMGRVQSDQNLLVSPESAGNIVEILVKEGDRVSKGQVLARLNTDALDRSVQELEVNLELANTLFERQEMLWKQNIGSEVQYLQAKSNKESLERRLEGLKAQRAMAVITSPVTGVVDDLIQKRGEMAGPATPFARIVNLDKVYITADVSEVYLNQVRHGDSIQVYFPVLDLTRNAIIARTSSVLDPDSRTFRIRIELDNSRNQIRPNLMAVLKLRTYQNHEAVVVPSILIKRDFVGDFLFVAEENNGRTVARKRYIERGLNDNNNTVVYSGLNSGDGIITLGYGQVVDGTVLNHTGLN